MNEPIEETIHYTIGTTILTSKIWKEFVISEIKRYRGWNELLKLMTALESEMEEQEKLIRRRQESRP